MCNYNRMRYQDIACPSANVALLSQNRLASGPTQGRDCEDFIVFLNRHTSLLHKMTTGNFGGPRALVIRPVIFKNLLSSFDISNHS